MTSMVLDYRVKDATAFAGIKPGDVIEATMAMGRRWLAHKSVDRHGVVPSYVQGVAQRTRSNTTRTLYG